MSSLNIKLITYFTIKIEIRECNKIMKSLFTGNTLKKLTPITLEVFKKAIKANKIDLATEKIANTIGDSNNLMTTKSPIQAIIAKEINILE